MDGNTDNKEKIGYGKPPKEYQFKKGQSGNPGGRPKNTLKDYVRQKFMAMTDREKEKFLSQIPASEQWRMGEGNPKQDTDITTDGEKIQGVIVLPQKDADSLATTSETETSISE